MSNRNLLLKAEIFLEFKFVEKLTINSMRYSIYLNFTSVETIHLLIAKLQYRSKKAKCGFRVLLVLCTYSKRNTVFYIRIYLDIYHSHLRTYVRNFKDQKNKTYIQFAFFNFLLKIELECFLQSVFSYCLCCPLVNSFLAIVHRIFAIYHNWLKQIVFVYLLFSILYTQGSFPLKINSRV